MEGTIDENEEWWSRYGGCIFFWIHHEEIENEFEFGGRRNVPFLTTANEVGLKVLARIGPWCHGEVRNVGHPDWILERAQKDGFALRNNNTDYMSYVKRWYTNLAKEMESHFFKDGGPIVAVQVDNETSDWKYLLHCAHSHLMSELIRLSIQRLAGLHPNPISPKTSQCFNFRVHIQINFGTTR